MFENAFIFERSVRMRLDCTGLSLVLHIFRRHFCRGGARAVVKSFQQILPTTYRSSPIGGFSRYFGIRVSKFAFSPCRLPSRKVPLAV